MTPAKGTVDIEATCFHLTSRHERVEIKKSERMWVIVKAGSTRLGGYFDSYEQALAAAVRWLELMDEAGDLRQEAYAKERAATAALDAARELEETA